MRRVLDMKIVWHKIRAKFYVAALLGSFSEAVKYSETNEGYAQGYFPRCPGFLKPAEIKPEHLHKLKISVLGAGSILNAKWTSYHYHNVRFLAQNPEVDFSRKTVVYAPGYLESTALPVGRNLMVLYKKLGYNSLILEYVAFTTNVFPLVARSMPAIGKHVAEMLANLTTVGLDPKKLELVGLSLGGVSMTFIAKNFRQLTGTNVSQITALDPTGPCVRHVGPEHRLDPSDADFFLHIATNTEGYGIGTPVGHISVYVNGGEYQPGFFPSIICDNICSHMQALLIWYSALEHPTGLFETLQCDSVQQAKYHKCFDRKPMVTNTLDLITDKSRPGIYYLATSHIYPYYLGKRGLRDRSPYWRHITSLNDIEVLRVK